MNNKCLICNSNTKLVFELNASQSLDECTICGFVFSSQKIESVVDTPDFYIDDIMMSSSPKLVKKLKSIASERHKIFTKMLGKSDYTMLEIGCGTGETSEEWERLGVSYKGIDIDKSCIEAGKEKGYNVEWINFLDFTSEEKFDVITSSQVLEHNPDPVHFVQHSESLLKSGGIVHCDVPFHPDMNKFFNKILFKRRNQFGAITAPHHLFAYNKKSITTLFDPYFKVEVSVESPQHKRWGSAAHESYSKLRTLVLKIMWILGFSRGFLILIGKKK